MMVSPGWKVFASDVKNGTTYSFRCSESSVTFDLAE
jgi:hypothetical protein